MLRKSSRVKKVERAEQGLTFIARLYAIKRETRTLSPDERRRLRQEKAYPVLKDFHDWLTEAKRTVLGTNPLNWAVTKSGSCLIISSIQFARSSYGIECRQLDCRHCEQKKRINAHGCF
ncbi:IS66 family transposase [Xenorhabdus thailandensis]|uniref:IS66 family transposase n=1 Tax=Xenorhabdus thailandensis TaxID=3136255 RepID=UPI003BF60EBF